MYGGGDDFRYDSYPESSEARDRTHLGTRVDVDVVVGFRKLAEKKKALFGATNKVYCHKGKWRANEINPVTKASKDDSTATLLAPGDWTHETGATSPSTATNSSTAPDDPSSNRRPPYSRAPSCTVIAALGGCSRMQPGYCCSSCGSASCGRPLQLQLQNDGCSP
ncbi:hypothetical protein PRIPAC_79421 [Pristionchus pacificus]|uniref:Uncharacterized protein n=1 Tax=Pristionchus pacificus TaxID=54126 RepID=A0A2A6CQ96_PRIPA|nr:hypothetical protein PRIPAC_79421 [Pristionchus pacificus]|eukprot:PDM80384.1 hypothetical protein PRIPAC_32963 [Pristionchus pacificus]